MKYRIRKIPVIAIAALAGFTLSVTAMENEFSPNVSKTGEISLPADFAANMVHLGSWFVPDGDASGFHDVFTEKKSMETFRKTGKFPDGATLVKELRPHGTGDFTTGAGVSYSTTGVKQVFVMVKDAKGRFPENKNWGEGWGWALFKADSGNKNLSTNFRKDCLSCHIPAKNTDWIYTQGYPRLETGIN